MFPHIAKTLLVSPGCLSKTVVESAGGVGSGGEAVTTFERQEFKGRWQVVGGLMSALVSWEATSAEGGVTGTL